MEAESQVRILEQVELAHACAEAGHIQTACRMFDTARAMALELSEGKAKAAKLQNHYGKLIRERQKFRTEIWKRSENNPGPRLNIIADSLALPRPVVADSSEGEAKEEKEKTYSDLLAQDPYSYKVDSISQRYFTTDNAVNALVKELPEDLSGSHFLLHLGLNDCAKRMFLQTDRLIVSSLQANVNARFVEFSRKYRRQILRFLPGAHYVNITKFRFNLANILYLLRTRGAAKIVLTTIILPPVKFWQATPGIQRNFGQYNMAILEAVEENNVVLLDIDRMIWEAGFQENLEADGMHLSEKGHAFFAEKLHELLK